MTPIFNRTGVSPVSPNTTEIMKKAIIEPSHEHIAVGEVDELDDPVDQGVAERDQGEDQPIGHADHFGLEELLGPGDQDANHLEDQRTAAMPIRAPRDTVRQCLRVLDESARPETHAGRAKRPALLRSNWWSGGLLLDLRMSRRPAASSSRPCTR